MSIALGADRRLLFRLTLSEALLLGIGGSLVGMLPAQGVITLLRTLLLGQAAAMTPGFADLISTIGIGWPDALAGLATGAGTSLLLACTPLSRGVDRSGRRTTKGVNDERCVAVLARLKEHWVRHLLAALQVAVGVAVVTAGLCRRRPRLALR